MSSTSILDRIRALHPSADEYLRRAAPWVDRVPLIVIVLGVLWLIVVAVLWILATSMVVAFGLDQVFHYLVAALGVLLILLYVVAGGVAWYLAKKLARELRGPGGSSVSS